MATSRRRGHLLSCQANSEDAKKSMFHDLLTITDSFEHFTHFNGLFRGLLSKKMFLCTRETSRKPKTIESSLFVAADVLDKNTFDYDTNLWER